MSGAIGRDISGMTLREVLWCYEGVSYERWMEAAAVMSAIYNSQRAKASDKVWSFADFHPAHAADRKGRTGKQIVHGTQQWFAPEEVQWLPGHGPGVTDGR
jgi:hypothetical protein